MTTLGFFNANNLFMRYRFGRTFPGDMSRKSFVADPRFGFLPAYQKGMFEPYNEKQVELCAKALKGSGGLPDILCLCEVESLLALRVFNQEFLGGHYSQALLIDSFDFRQIDVAVLATREIAGIRSHVDDPDPAGKKGDRLFSRDCLEVTVELNKSGSKTLTLFVNHLKSKFVDSRGKSKAQIAAETKRATAKRERQAKAVRALIRERFPGGDFGKAAFAVVGDMNAAPDESSVAPLVKAAGLHNAIDDLPPEEQWTYWWKAKNRASLIDYVLLSPRLANATAAKGIKPEIERRGIGFKGNGQDGGTLPKETKILRDEDAADGLAIDFRFKRFAGVSEKLAASDHCPVTIELPI
jgi:endonuclease/exonuclease/phosphatase family metal-dependent hydrolase